ncbi:hypothetical protein FGO68_gene16289 [Halteria grandinella]|uniref:Agmatinase n=1 Tax=Halteria grandinella TaxID=5974 RepID=A0A8J8N9U0_HALGN|nr:hypothetical protein FGO68_gene16289 [Halteria grandinella]
MSDHADTGEDQWGALVGHGTPMRRLIDEGYVRGDKFLQLGLRGYWPDNKTLAWMRDQGMRSYEMTEIHHRGLKTVLDESFATLTEGCDGVFLSVDIDVVDPGMAPGTGTPEPGGMTSRELLEAVRRICLELPVVGIDVVEVAPAFDSADITAILANRVVLEALSAIAKRRNGSTYDPKQNLLDRQSVSRITCTSSSDVQGFTKAKRRIGSPRFFDGGIKPICFSNSASDHS